MFDSFEGLCNARWFRFSFLLSSRVKIDQDARSYLRRTISVGLLSYAESPPLCRREMKLLLSASLTSGRLSLSGTESGQKHVLMWKKAVMMEEWREWVKECANIIWFRILRGADWLFRHAFSLNYNKELTRMGAKELTQVWRAIVVQQHEFVLQGYQ